MLIKITNQCSMGCTHCMEDALPVGDHMSMETFLKAKAFIERIYGSIRIVMLTGGEPTENPLLMDFIGELSGWHVTVMSNGLFLTENTNLARKLLGSDIISHIQIYNDTRYYPRKVDPINHPKIIFGDKINLMSPFGRALKNGFENERQSPPCFNLRSSARTLRDFSEAVLSLRMSGKMCSPSIDIDGGIVAGECYSCFKLGTVESPDGELLEKLLNMKCNKCGLEDNLPNVLKNIINGKGDGFR